jgi:hypothetical protein
MHTSRDVRWQDGEMWLGYFEEFPDYLTRGESLAELEENLRDLDRVSRAARFQVFVNFAELSLG